MRIIKVTNIISAGVAKGDIFLLVLANSWALETSWFFLLMASISRLHDPMTSRGLCIYLLVSWTQVSGKERKQQETKLVSSLSQSQGNTVTLF